MKAQAQAGYNCKHHNTWKALVGIPPNGTGTYISSLWTDQVSHKELTKCSGLLEKLEPRDNIMSDRGLDNADTLSYGVTLNIPLFKSGRD